MLLSSYCYFSYPLIATAPILLLLLLLSSYCYCSFPPIATAPILLLLLLLSSYCYCSFPPIATAPILLLLLLLSSYYYCSFPPIATASIATDIIPSIVSDPAVVKPNFWSFQQSDPHLYWFTQYSASSIHYNIPPPSLPSHET